MLYGIDGGIITVQAIADDKINIFWKISYTPQMDSNLLSITTLYDHGFEVSSKPGYDIKVLKDGILIIETIHEG
jgi:hypothetical protein